MSVSCSILKMSLLTDLLNLNLSETTDNIIAEYIWLVSVFPTLSKLCFPHVLSMVLLSLCLSLRGFRCFLEFVWVCFCFPFTFYRSVFVLLSLKCCFSLDKWLLGVWLVWLNFLCCSYEQEFLREFICTMRIAIFHNFINF